MAKKKTRRVPRSSTPRMYGDGTPSQATKPQEASTGQPAPSATTGAVPTQSRGTNRPPAAGGAARASAARAPISLAEEYHYVIGDLRHLGIQAAVTFAVLIILGFILR
jgi:hypothetical protein